MDDYIQVDYSKKVLDLSDQNINDVQLDNAIPNVQTLVLSNNPLKTLSFLKYVNNIKILHLDSCNLHDFHFQHLHFLRQLTVLIARNNQITTLRNYNNNLKILDLSQNNLTSVYFVNSQEQSQLQQLDYGCTVFPNQLSVLNVFKQMFLYNQIISQTNLLNDELRINYSFVKNRQQLKFTFDLIASNISQSNKQHLQTSKTVQVKIYFTIGCYEIKMISFNNYELDDEITIDMNIFQQINYRTNYSTDNLQNQNSIITKYIQEKLGSSEIYGFIDVSFQEEHNILIYDINQKQIINIDQFQQLNAIQSQNNLTNNIVANNRQKNKFDINQKQVVLSSNNLQVNQLINLSNTKNQKIYLINYFYTKQTYSSIIDQISHLIQTYNINLSVTQINNVMIQAFTLLQQKTLSQQHNRNIDDNYQYDVVQLNKKYSINLQLLLHNTIIPYRLELELIQQTMYNEELQNPSTAQNRYLVAQIFSQNSNSNQILISKNYIQNNSCINGVRVKYFNKRKIITFYGYFQDKRVSTDKIYYTVVRNQTEVLYQGFKNYLLLRDSCINNYDGLIQVTAQETDSLGQLLSKKIKSDPVYVIYEGNLKQYKNCKVQSKYLIQSVKKPIYVNSKQGTQPKPKTVKQEQQQVAAAKTTKTTAKTAEKQNNNVFDLQFINEEELKKEIKSKPKLINQPINEPVKKKRFADEESDETQDTKKSNKNDPDVKSKKAGKNEKQNKAEVAAKKEANQPVAAITASEAITLQVQKPFETFADSVIVAFRENFKTKSKPSFYLFGKLPSMYVALETEFKSDRDDEDITAVKFKIPREAVGMYVYFAVQIDDQFASASVAQNAIKYVKKDTEVKKKKKKKSVAPSEKSKKDEKQEEEVQRVFATIISNNQEVSLEGYEIVGSSLAMIFQQDIMVEYNEIKIILPNKLFLDSQKLPNNKYTLQIKTIQSQLEKQCSFINFNKQSQKIFTDAFFSEQQKQLGSDASLLVNDINNSLLVVIRGKLFVFNFTEQDERDQAYLKLNQYNLDQMNFNDGKYYDEFDPDFKTNDDVDFPNGAFTLEQSLVTSIGKAEDLEAFQKQEKKINNIDQLQVGDTVYFSLLNEKVNTFIAAYTKDNQIMYSDFTENDSFVVPAHYCGYTIKLIAINTNTFNSINVSTNVVGPSESKLAFVDECNAKGKTFTQKVVSDSRAVVDLTIEYSKAKTIMKYEKQKANNLSLILWQLQQYIVFYSTEKLILSGKPNETSPDLFLIFNQ